ncbi:hypothetical protein TIFTF001_001939 [Ficus carica]|uniref:Uncharacterized protein n=1 Tax=Ficus carica TaxID=3494 RepID=A0AA87Z3T0_FICCA|nr:hypothetical protein TIFTF001_001939 [Ficus carica]
MLVRPGHRTGQNYGSRAGQFGPAQIPTTRRAWVAVKRRRPRAPARHKQTTKGKKKREKKRHMENKEEDEEEEEERREAAIALTPSLQPDFKPKSSAISQSQLSKFQRDCIPIIVREGPPLLPHFSYLDGRTKLHCKDSSTKDFEHKDSSFFGSENNNNKDNSLLQQESSITPSAPTQRQKLHWGLDTKERWERKANM